MEIQLILIYAQVMKQDAKYHHVPRWFEYISQLGASLLVDATGRLFRDYDYVQERQTKEPARKPVNFSLEEQFRGSRFSRKPKDFLADESEDDEVLSPQQRADCYEKDQENNLAKTKGQPLLTLEYLVSSMSIFGVTNPHDSIYAMLGIGKDTTPTSANKRLRVTDHTQMALEMFTAKKQYLVDYKASYTDVCKEFIQFCVRQNMKRDPSRALDVICRPWALEQEENGESDEPPASWLPRLSRASYGMVLGPGIEGKRMGRKNADPLVGLPDMVHRNYNAAETKGLNTKHFRFRKRQTRSDQQNNGSRSPALATNTTESANGTSPQVTGHLPNAQAKSAHESKLPTDVRPSDAHRSANTNGPPRTKSKVYGTTSETLEEGLNHFSLYVEGFVLDTVESVKSHSQSGSIPAEWASFAGWKSIDGTPPEHFWRTLVADRGSDGKNPPVYYSRACQESFRKGGTIQGVVDTTGLIEHERNSVVAQFCRRVQAAIWNRALIKTKAGRLGLASSDVKPGDLVCIFYGCSVPVVLRRQRQKTQSVMDAEREHELMYIASYLVKSYRMHLARRAVFRDKREKDKHEYKRWEDGKRSEWEKDEEWKTQWSLVREGLGRIHEFRAWVTKKWVIQLEASGDLSAANDAKANLKKYINKVLPVIHQIAAWALKSDAQGNIIDHLANRTNEKIPEDFELTQAQIELWTEFTSDDDWSREWQSLMDAYEKEEGFRAWAKKHNHPIGYREDQNKRREEWAKEPARNWTHKWASENSWFLCIDPFRSWLREKSKFCGSEEEIEQKLKWDADHAWRSQRNGDENEVESFKAWTLKNGNEDSKQQIGEIDEETAQYVDWRFDWRTSHQRASLPEEWKAWENEHQKREADGKKRKVLENEERNRKLEKKDKEPFLERWRMGHGPPAINGQHMIDWREFEIALSYGKHWVKFVKRRKQQHVEDQKNWWSKEDAILQRQKQRAALLPEHYVYPPAVTKGSPNSNLGNLQDLSVDRMNRMPDTLSAAGAESTTSSETISNSLPHKDIGDTYVTTKRRSASEGHDRSAPTMDGLKSGASGVGPSHHRRAQSGRNEHSFSGNDLATRVRIDSMTGITKETGLLPYEEDPASFRPPTRAMTNAELYEGYEGEEIGAWAGTIKSAEDLANPITHAKLMASDPQSPSAFQYWKDEKAEKYPRLWKKVTKITETRLAEWRRATPKLLGVDGRYYYDRGRPRVSKSPTEDDMRSQAFEGRQEANLQEARGLQILAEKCPISQVLNGDQEPSTDKATRRRYPPGHFFTSKERAVLTEDEAAVYMAKVKEKFRKRLGDEERWCYHMLGECYLHGMMDGAAMAYQNDNQIPPKVFEIR